MLMKNRQKTLQDEEKMFQLRQNGSKIHQIAQTHRENEVLSPEIQFDTDLRRKKRIKTPKSQENCP